MQSANQMDQNLRTIQKKRTANFREDETRLLIQLWGSASIQNKLFLTHRKAPVMRLLAANMQQRGFYRTPDEIKTRIRNLKCLYHRIKRSMSNGTGIGTVDPDWPHFKAMDEILSKEYPRKLTDRILEEQMETKYEDIKVKQEVDDIDIDDNDSWATNDSPNSEYEDDGNQVPSPAPIAPIVTMAKPSPIQHGSIQVKKTSTLQAQPMQHIRMQAPVNSSHATVKAPIPIQPAIKSNTVLNTIQMPTSQVTQNGQVASQKGGIPFPLLILNNLNPADKNSANRVQTNHGPNQQTDSSNNALKELVDLHKQTLELAKQQIEIDKQRLEFDRVIGTQLVTMMPMLCGVLQRLSYTGNQDLLDMKFNVDSTGVKRKRRASDAAEIMTDSKKLRQMLEKAMRQYMLLYDEEEDEANTLSAVDKIESKESGDSSKDKPNDIARKISADLDVDEGTENSSEKDEELCSIDGDALEPNIVIEHDEDDEQVKLNSQNEQINPDEEEEEEDEEKLVIETRRRSRSKAGKAGKKH